MHDIRAGLMRVRERIASAAERAGRGPDDVLLVAVSKTVDADRVKDAIAAGASALGENRVQEAKAKVDVVGRQVPWHLIGRLQTNKAKDAVAIFDVIQSIDRLDIARECERRAAGAGRPIDVFLEVNIAGEPQKSGFAPDDVAGALDALGGMAHLKIRGLMAIPPAVQRAEDSRPAFRALRTLAERHHLRELSMGMSSDYEVAVEEGATIVRVGTAIFGPRTQGTS